MVDIASLAIQIDTSDVARAENDLERLGAKGAKAEQAAKGVGDAYQQASGKVGAVAGAASKAGTALERNSVAARKNARELESVESAASSLSDTMSDLGATLAGLTAGITIKGIIDSADSWGQYASRIKMATQSAEEYDRVQSRMAKSANDTYRSINETREGFIQMSPILRDMGLSLDQSIDAIDAFSGLLVINSASAERGSAAMSAYSKSLQKGKIDADSWATIASTMPSVLKTIADSSGMAEAEIRKLGSEGKLSVGILTKAFVDGTDQIKAGVDGMPTTVRDALQKLGNSFQDIVGWQNEASGSTAALAGAFESLGVTMGGIAAVYRGVLPEFASANDLTKEQEQSLIKTADAMKVMGAVAGVYAVAATAIKTATVAQAAFNVAAQANPYIFIAASIGAATAAIYTFMGAQDRALDSAVNMWEQATKSTAGYDVAMSRVSETQRLVTQLHTEQIAKEDELQKLRDKGFRVWSRDADKAKQLEAEIAEIQAQRVRLTDLRVEAEKSEGERKKKALEEEKKLQDQLNRLLGGTSDEQAKALASLLTQTEITTKSANAMADAYLAGADSVRALTLEQKVEEQLLKTGSAARDQVTKSITEQQAALDRLDIAELVSQSRLMTADLKSQAEVYKENAKSVTAGEAAQRAYNVEKQISAALAGKNASALSKETAELRKQLGIQEDIREELEAHKKIAGLIDSTATSQEKLNRRMAELRELMAHAKTPEQITAIQRAMKEAQDDASQWAKWTEGALDRVDSAFADAWRNIGDGFSSFRDSLTNAFKQMLAELAHMAITKPIIMQIGAMMGIGGGTQGNNGIWGSLLGGGSGGGGGGYGIQDGLSTVSAARNAYSLYSVGLAGMANTWGGYLAGAGNMLGMTGLGNFGIGMQGATLAPGLAGPTTVGASGSMGAGAQVGSSLSSMGGLMANPVTWIAAGMLASSKFYDAGYRLDTEDVARQKANKMSFAIDPALSSVLNLGVKTTELATKLLGGGKIANILTGGSLIAGVTGAVDKALFGGAWKTKDYGLGLSIADGALGAEQFEYRKKKGGLFSSSKKKTIWTELDEETATALQEAYDATEEGVASIFESLSLSVEEGTLAGLQLARKQISTKGKTEEEIQKAISEWFGEAAEAMSAELNRVFGTGLEYDLAGMQAFVGNLQGVNALFEQLNYELYESTVAGGRMAEQLSAVAGGFDALAANVSTYYDAFYTGAEKTANVVESITRAFEDAEVALAGNRAEYRAMVDNIDRTTEAGREMFATLMALSGQAATYYSTLEQQLMGGVNNAYASLQRSIANQQREIQQQASSATASISALTGISNSLDAALKRLRGTSDDTVRSLRAQAVMTLNSALVTARSGGSLAGFAGLQDALDVASQMDTALYASLVDFEREQGRTANLIAELEKVNGKQLSVEQQVLKSLESQLSALDQQLLFAQAQLDALNGVDNSVLSIVDAVNAMNASVVAALSLMGGDAGKNATPGNAGTLVESVYRSVLGRDADAGGLAYWQNDVASGAIRLDQLEQAIKNAARENGELRGFAVGGYTGAGDKWDPAGIVHKGEVVWSQSDIAKWGGVGTVEAMRKGGPELEVTGPSRIYSASQTAAMLGGGGDSGSVAELRQLRAEIHNDLRQMAKFMEQTATSTRQMNQSGVQIVGTVQTKGVAA